VIGAGVIGQVYAGRLATAGHDITLMARGEHAGDLLKKGIRLDTRGQTATCRVAVTTTAPAGEDYDCVLVAVRFDQLHPALEVARTVSAQQVVTLCNVPDRADRLPVLLGRDQVILAFPGVGGRIGEDGVVHYADVRQQHTSIGKADGAERQLALALRSAQFPVDLVDDMPAWLTTHALFIASVGAAILLSGGDSATLGRDRAATARMVAAVAEAFAALRRQGVRPVPTPLRSIFTAVPRAIAVPYWQRQLRGPMGTQTIAPHIRATRGSELPALTTATRRLLQSSAPTFDALLRDADL
jgi:2-dehydropantoate 2-reductase